MKTNRMLTNRKTGGILVIVMVVLIAFSLLMIGLLQLGRYNAIETAVEYKNIRAHWMAEAGFEKISAMISLRETNSISGFPSIVLDEDFENDPSKGHYQVTAYQTPGGSPEEAVFHIESVGTVNDAGGGVIEARVRSVLTGAPGVDQGFVALGGESKIKSSSSINISGDVYIAGSGTIGKNATITGTLEDGQDAYDIPDPAVDVPFLNFPKIDRTPYQTLVNNAAGLSASNYTGSVTFNGATNYYNGDVTITGISGSGAGVVVATGSISVEDKTHALPPGARLVAGTNIIFKIQAATSGNNELFAFGDITFNSNTELLGIGNSLLAMGGISLSANASPFAGIIYAEGKYSGSNYGVIFASGQQTSMSGTVIAWYGFDIESNLTFTYDRSVFANPNPIPFLGWVLTSRRQWEETPFNTP